MIISACLKGYQIEGGAGTLPEVGQTERLPGAVRPDHGMVRAYTTVTPRGTSARTPASSALSPLLGTSRMPLKRIPEVVPKKNTRKNDNLRR